MHGIKILMAKSYVDNLGEETKKRMTADDSSEPRPIQLYETDLHRRVLFWKARTARARITRSILERDRRDGKRIIEPHPVDARTKSSLWKVALKASCCVRFGVWKDAVAARCRDFGWPLSCTVERPGET